MPKIQKFIVFGDSLSDRKWMDNSLLAPFSGLTGKSQDGRFTNAYVWFEYFLRSLIGHEEVRGDERFVATHEVPDLARTYCVGGMTSSNYQKVSKAVESDLLKVQESVMGTKDLIIDELAEPVEAQVLANLEGMRTLCLEDNATLQVTPADKEETLVIEWSGANDLITINECPTEEAAHLAIDARIAHVKAMIAEGYKYFILFNLPGLELTPRFQNGEAHLRDAAKTSVDYFNEQLKGELAQLRVENHDCRFDLFDVHTHFEGAYTQPTHYGFDSAKRTAIYTDSTTFKAQGMRAPEAGYLFWDRVHPMRRVHELLAGYFKTLFEQHYTFELKAEDHVRQFKLFYAERLIADKARRGCFVKSRIDYKKHDLTIDQILHHGVFERGYRTLGVTQALGWVNQERQSTGKHPLMHAFFVSKAAQGGVLPEADEVDPNLVAIDGFDEGQDGKDLKKSSFSSVDFN